MTIQTPDDEDGQLQRLPNKKIENLLKRLARQARLPLLHGTGADISWSIHGRAHDGQRRSHRRC